MHRRLWRASSLCCSTAILSRCRTPRSPRPPEEVGLGIKHPIIQTIPLRLVKQQVEILQRLRQPERLLRILLTEVESAQHSLPATRSQQPCHHHTTQTSPNPKKTTYLKLRTPLRNIINRTIPPNRPSMPLHRLKHLPSAIAPILLPRDPPHVEYGLDRFRACLLYTSPSPRDGLLSRMPSSA